MKKTTLTLLIGGVVLLAGAGLLVPDLVSEPDVPVARWQAQDEIEVPAEPAQLVNAGDVGSGALDRSAADAGSLPPGADERIEVVLRGRVIDKFQAPIAQATVWLDYGRSGPRGGSRETNRRVPDPVRTDTEGCFAFQGETFRNLRVSLQVTHDSFAVARFDKDVGRVDQEVDLGDLMLAAGGEVRGRVTDLEGNGVPGAQLRVQTENENPLRMLRDRERMLPPFVTDQNGYFRRPHLAAGEWSVVATAKRHTEGRSPTFRVEEDQATDLEDIRLGPGFELAGSVHGARGEVIAKASVVLQGDARRAGPGGGGPGGWQQHRTTTDEQGRFFLEHLPATTMRLQVDAAGYLDTRVEGIDPTLGQPVAVTMQDGLRIEGSVRDGKGDAVALFAFRAVRVRGLPAGPSSAEAAELGELMNRMRDPNLSEEARGQLRASVDVYRARMAAVERMNVERVEMDRMVVERGRRGGAGPWRELDKPEQHEGGTFVATGLQEGFYEVHVQSPDHARYRSAEIELRAGLATPKLEVALDAGVSVAGVVVDVDGAPVGGAAVELRTAPPEGAGRTRARPGLSAGNDVVVGLPNAAREAMRGMVGGPAMLEAKTDGKGAFVIRHVPRGAYRLQANARGFANATTESFELQADRSGFELRLGKLGSIAGAVSGLKPEEIAATRVGAMQAGGGGGVVVFLRGGAGGAGPFHSVQVAADGSYRIEELVPGDYVVRAWIGSPQDLMRELGPRLGEGKVPADATVAAGKETKLDVGVTRPQVGAVEGSVRNNGDPARGWAVELVPQEAPGSGPGRVRWTGFGSLRANVASSGRFAIAKVPAGAYTLRVLAEGPMRLPMHTESVQVLDGSTLERSISVVTYSLQGTLKREDGGDPAGLEGVVTLYRGLTAVPENAVAWARENGRPMHTEVRGGAFRFDSLPPGQYLLAYGPPGRRLNSTLATMQVDVQGNQTVTMTATRASTAPTEAGATRPGTGGR